MSDAAEFATSDLLAEKSPPLAGMSAASVRGRIALGARGRCL